MSSIFSRIWNEETFNFSEPAQKFNRSRASKRNSLSVKNLWSAWANSQAKKVTCGAKTRSGNPCQKPPLQGKTRCRLHGGMSLAGKDHPNFKHGHCTLESRRQTADGNAYIKYLESLLIRLEIIMPKRRKRNTMFWGFWIHLCTKFRYLVKVSQHIKCVW